MVPAFIDWQKLLNSVSNGSVLEIGTGAGRALLDLKALYPFANAFGTNHYRDGYSQIEGSIESMWNVSEHFNIPVHCNHSGSPLFPTLLNLGKIQHEWLPLPPESFDLIFSRHSLNDGKLEPSESHCFVPRLHKLLRPGGAAILHLLWDTGPVSPALVLLPAARAVAPARAAASAAASAAQASGGGASGPQRSSPSPASWALPKTDTLLRVTSVADASGAATSLVLFETEGSCGTGRRREPRHCVGLAMRKCPPAAPLHPVHGDCILPADLRQDGEAAPPRSHTDTSWRVAYHRRR